MYGHFTGKIEVSGAQTGLLIFMAIAFVWIAVFIADKMIFIAMYACASYYFSSEGGNDG